MYKCIPHRKSTLLIKREGVQIHQKLSKAVKYYPWEPSHSQLIHTRHFYCSKIVEQQGNFGVKKELLPLSSPKASAYNPELVESEWYQWWEQLGIFKPQFKPDGGIKEAGIFCIPSPPPNITGALHIGHALTISIQDCLVRYNRMKGKTVLFLPGFDHAGVATQSVVEKQIWKQEKKTKDDFHRYEFVRKVWDWKDIYHKRIKSQFKIMGGSYDWNREAFTLDESRSRAVTEAFIRLHDEGLIYRESKLVNWSTKLNTAISNLEVDNIELEGKTLLNVPDYNDPVEFGIMTYFAYDIVDSETHEKLIVSTTRPETIFGDVAIAIHPNDKRYQHLHNKVVKHPFLNKKLPIILDEEIVDMELGTGAVKITPAHDEKDYQVGKRHDLEMINIFTDDGLLNENTGSGWEGMKRFDARIKVIDSLKKMGHYVKQEENPMTVPICSRSGDVIEPLLKPQWWLSQKEMARRAIKIVQQGEIKIQPKHSENEYFHWLSNIQDWCISRQLWWGHPCPVYFVTIEGETNNKDDGRYWIAAEDIDSARKKAQIRFPHSKFSLESDEDVLDTWFSSALWPLSTLGWPRDTRDLAIFYPYSILVSGWDILFFWITRMILLDVKLSDSIPFREIFCHPLIRDSEGRKMSKSLGNVIDPIDIINGISLEKLETKLRSGNLPEKEIEFALKNQKRTYPRGIPQCGTDALRFALCSYVSNNNSNDINLDLKKVMEYRKFINKIYQATKFLLMKLEDRDGDGVGKVNNNEGEIRDNDVISQWVLHELNSCILRINISFEERDFLNVTNEIYQMWYIICNNYIEYVKFVMNNDEREEEKKIINALQVLYFAIESSLRLIHPFMPFVSEELWQRLKECHNNEFRGCQSISTAEYPQFEEKHVYEQSHEVGDNVWSIIRDVKALCEQYEAAKDSEVTIRIGECSMLRLVRQEGGVIEHMLRKHVKSVKFAEEGEEVLEKGWISKSVSSDITVSLLITDGKNMDDVRGKIKRLEGKIAKLEQKLQGLERVVSSLSYSAKVSDSVKRANLAKMRELRSKIASQRHTLRNFQGLL